MTTENQKILERRTITYIVAVCGLIGLSMMSAPIFAMPATFNLQTFSDIASRGADLGGGSPNEGIPRDSSSSFGSFPVGSGSASLDESIFLSMLSLDAAGPSSENMQYALAKLQRTGISGRGSDGALPMKDAAARVPEPASLFLVGTGLIGLAGLGRRFLRLREEKEASKSEKEPARS